MENHRRVMGDLSDKSSKKMYDLDGPSFKKELFRTPDAVLLDVGSAIEFFEGTLPGALNIDYMDRDFGRKVSFLDPDKTYFVFCRNGNRSAAASKEMTKQGLKIFNLEKGMDTWPDE